MNGIQKQRLYLTVFFLIGLAIATTLVLYALKQSIDLFLTPSQLFAKETVRSYHCRLGGMVKVGSVKRENTGLGIDFLLTDFKREAKVHYEGTLPDLFREGKGAVVSGSLNAQGVFIATEVLAKHDENYMPRPIGPSIAQK